MHLVCVVPARLGSSRFPAKLLQNLQGEPVLRRTIQVALSCPEFSDVYCLADHPSLLECLSGLSCHKVLCGESSNGTERIARNLESITGEWLVNLQGDEPFFPLEALQFFARQIKSQKAPISLLAHPASLEELCNPHRVKLHLNVQSHSVQNRGEESSFELLGVSRGEKVVGTGSNLQVTQLGVYGYHRNYLENYRSHLPSKDETELSHEILRLPWGSELRVYVGDWKSRPVDTPEDLQILQNSVPRYGA